VENEACGLALPLSCIFSNGILKKRYFLLELWRSRGIHSLLAAAIVLVSCAVEEQVGCDAETR
jgi:hypothetical protein